MDIQGAEAQVLEGMKRILRDRRDLTMFMEFWPKGLREAGAVPEKVIEDLKALGLKVEVFYQRTGTLRAVDDAVLAKSLVGNQYLNLLVSSGKR